MIVLINGGAVAIEQVCVLAASCLCDENRLAVSWSWADRVPTTSLPEVARERVPAIFRPFTSHGLTVI